MDEFYNPRNTEEARQEDWRLVDDEVDIYAVGDDVNPPSNKIPGNPPSLSPTQDFVHWTCRNIQHMYGKGSLKDQICDFNDKVPDRYPDEDYGRADTIPSTSLAVVRKTGENIEIVQAGDTMAIVQCYGSITTTHNKVRPHTVEFLEKMAAGGYSDENGNWEEGAKLILPDIQRRMNTPEGNGWAMLNGQPGFRNYLTTMLFDTAKVRRIMLVTDGFFWPGATVRIDKFALTILAAYDEGGWQGLLEWSDAGAKAEGLRANNGEATGVHLQFTSN